MEKSLKTKSEKLEQILPARARTNRENSREKIEESQRLVEISESVCESGYFIFCGKLHIGKNKDPKLKNCQNCRYPGCDWLY